MLANVVPQDGAQSAQKKFTIPTLPATPPASAGGSSFVDFDPRGPAQRPERSSDVELTPVGDGDGFRTKTGPRLADDRVQGRRARPPVEPQRPRPHAPVPRRRGGDFPPRRVKLARCA
jgi:hypothetical protein